MLQAAGRRADRSVARRRGCGRGRAAHDARWIFHIGHVGSTLVSRLLGELDGVLAVREPRLLRDLALSPPEVRQRYIAPVAKLMSRTFAESTRSPASKRPASPARSHRSSCRPANARCSCIATPRNYIASILAGENRVKELRVLAGGRAAAARRARHRHGPAQQRCRARGRRLGVRDDRAGSGGRGDGGPADRLGRFRRDAWRHGRRARRALPPSSASPPIPIRLARDRHRTADEPLFEGARI